MMKKRCICKREVGVIESIGFCKCECGREWKTIGKKWVLSTSKPEDLQAIEFIEKFTDNFTRCDLCNGSGIQPVTNDDACRSCGGTGVQVASYGVLIAELYPEAMEIKRKAAK